MDVDSGVNTAIRKLRAALKDSPETPVFIERVPGKGYRFIGRASQPDRPAEATARPDRPARRWLVAGLALGVATAAAVIYYVGFRPAGRSAPGTSVTIAVLPFQNLSSDPEQTYFSDGLTEETIAALGRVAPSRIRVISWTSSMAYRGTRKTAGEIGGELAASYLVESTVRREKEHLRITSKLVRVRDQVQVWNNTYDLEIRVSLEYSKRSGARSRAKSALNSHHEPNGRYVTRQMRTRTISICEAGTTGISGLQSRCARAWKTSKPQFRRTPHMRLLMPDWLTPM